jgi:hypothetical protein
VGAQHSSKLYHAVDTRLRGAEHAPFSDELAEPKLHSHRLILPYPQSHSGRVSHIWCSMAPCKPKRHDYRSLSNDDEVDGAILESRREDCRGECLPCVLLFLDDGSAVCSSWIITICALCTILNAIGVCLFLARPSVFASGNSQAPLKRPNQFLGIERFYRAYPTLRPDKPLITFPSLLAQINIEAPRRVLPISHRSYPSTFGTVYTDQAFFAVNSTVRQCFASLRKDLTYHVQVNTVTQFRTREFGMEQCELRISLPLLNPSSERFENRSLVGSPSNVSVDVWRLSASAVLSSRGLSGHSRPARVERLAMGLLIGLGTNASSPRFDCPRDSLQTFEIVCSYDCEISFWQDRADPVSGQYFPCPPLRVPHHVITARASPGAIHNTAVMRALARQLPRSISSASLCRSGL